jgi:TonB family protein
MRLLLLTFFIAKIGLGQLAIPVTQPELISKSEPGYTDEARRAEVNATAAVHLIVGTDGVPQEVEILHGMGFGLDESALAAVKTWRFKPATQQGVPMRVPANVEVSFQLLNGSHAGQSASLNFTLPEGASRPELREGTMPVNPPSPSPAGQMRATLTVDVDGVPKDVTLETTDPGLEDYEKLQIRSWRFRPAKIGDLAVEVKGVFELTRTPIPTQPLGVGKPMVPLPDTDPSDPSMDAPRLISPAEGAAFDNFPRTTIFRWEPSTGAASYIIQVDYKENGGWHDAPGGFSLPDPRFTFDFVGMQPGRWRVWPVNAQGVRGTPSEWRMFRYTR